MPLLVLQAAKIIFSREAEKMEIIKIENLFDIEDYYDKINDKDWLSNHCFDLSNAKFPAIHIQGRNYNSSINISIMKNFCTLQTNLNKQYAKDIYNDENKRLSVSEYKMLELFIQVNKGSSEFLFTFPNLLETASSIKTVISITKALISCAKFLKNIFKNSSKENLPSASIKKEHKSFNVNFFGKIKFQNEIEKIEIYEKNIKETYNEK